MSSSSGPVFLAGADRSGIGLLGELLDNHPGFAISRRTNFWTFYHNRFGDLSRSPNLDRCLDEMLRFRRIQELEIDRHRLRDDFLACDDRSYARLFALIGRQHAERRGKQTWGDKSLNSERHADIILSSYPDGRMVHVIRDPRDRHASIESRRGGKRGGVYGSTAVWLSSEHWAERNARIHAGRYLVLRYEDLVDDGEKALRGICAFLGVPYDDSMLADPSSPGGRPRELHDRSVGRFSTGLTFRRQALIQALAGEEMSRRGYRPVSIRLPAGSGLISRGLDIPLGRVLVKAWTPWSSFKSRHSRGPSSRRLVG